MPRPTYPHTVEDVERALDGTFGLVVGDLPGGDIYVLKRLRHSGEWSVSHFTDPSRKQRLSRDVYRDRQAALDHFLAAIGLAGPG